MKISVVTVCYNSAKTIRDAMESVAAQGDAEIEYIVVDGGSTDGTVEEVKKFAGEMALAAPRREARRVQFRWISEKDRGLYDAINKGIRMATGEVVGIVHSDDVLADDGVIAKIAREFEAEDGGKTTSVQQQGGTASALEAVYGDIRFVRDLRFERDDAGISGPDAVRNLPTVRYCSGKWFRPWMFRFATMPAHPSIWMRKECFEKYGFYSLDYRICADFELMMRMFWKHRIRAKYMPLCTTVMRMGGASTGGLRSNVEINREDVRALRANGYWSCLPLAYLKYFFKIWGFVNRR